VFLWGVVGARVGRADLTAPIVFVGLGLLLSEGLSVLDPDPSREAVKALAELALVWVLFAGAARTAVRELRADAGLDLRLLVVGLPLTVVLGTVLAAWLVPGLDWWLALLVGAALAPTDAALGAAVITNPVVPARIRGVLDVESGLNDGIATPVVAVAIAGAAAAGDVSGIPGPAAAVTDLVVGLAVGAAVGLLGGVLWRAARRRGWAGTEFAGPAVLALALCAYTGALAAGANGFVAAFVGGLAFGNTGGRGVREEAAYVEQTGTLVSLVVWLLFGAVGVPAVVDDLRWQTVVYAVLSLTVVRMLPVAVALARARLGRETVAFVGWFGPRGLASVIFALLALEELRGEADPVVAVIATTVLLSVLVHGLTARPLARRYGRAAGARDGGRLTRPGGGPSADGRASA